MCIQELLALEHFTCIAMQVCIQTHEKNTFIVHSKKYYGNGKGHSINMIIIRWLIKHRVNAYGVVQCIISLHILQTLQSMTTNNICRNQGFQLVYFQYNHIM